MSMNTAAAKPSQVSEAPPARTESQKSSAAKRILVVDDELMNIKFMTKVLAKAGYEPVQALMAKDALRILAEEPIDLVLADIMMPEVNGIQMVRIIRQVLKLDRLPIFMCTADSDREKIVEAAKLNVQAYILKPIDWLSLLERIAQVFDASETT